MARPDDVGLGQRRVVATGQTEAALKAEGGAEHASLAFDVGQDRLAGVGDILAEDPDPLVLLHLLVEGPFDGFTQGDDLAGTIVGGFGFGPDVGQGDHVVADGGRDRAGARPGPGGRRRGRSGGLLL